MQQKRLLKEHFFLNFIFIVFFSRYHLIPLSIPAPSNTTLSMSKAKGTFTMLLVPILDLSQFNPEYLTAGLEKAESWGSDPLY